MIPATVRCYARFQSKITGNADREATYWDYMRVLAWDDDGRALVRPNKGGQLVPAEHFRNFDSLSDSADFSPLVALLPAGGWRIEITSEDGVTWSEPLVGWGLREDGDIVPLSTDSTGYVETDTDHMGGKVRIYHDEQRDAPSGHITEPEQESA